MSYNALEAFNAQMSDAEMNNEYVCSDRQYVYINDAMNFNYNTGYINFNSVQMVGSDPKKVLDLNSGFLLVPNGAVASLSGDAESSFGTYNSTGKKYVLSKTDAMLLAPKGVHHQISQISVRMGGVTVHQPISHLNYYLNEQLKNMNADQYRMFSDLIGHAWDSADSYTLDSAILERNDNVVADGTFSAGLDADSFANTGHVQRIIKNNADLTTDTMRLGIAGAKNALKTAGGVASSSVLQDVFQPALIGVYAGTTALTPDADGVYSSADVAGTGGAKVPITTLVFQYISIIPLSIISNFFKEMPSVNTLSNFEIKLLTNLSPSNSWAVVYGTKVGTIYPVAKTESSQSIGETCPYLLSRISSDGLKGPACTIVADDKITVSPFVGFYNSAPNLAVVGTRRSISQNSLSQCQIWIPSVNLTDPYMELLLNNKVKRILYNDYQQDATLTDIGPYSTAQRLLTYQVSRLRKLHILPYLSNASATDPTKACDPRQSLVSSAPNTCSFAKLSNLQVYLGSVNLFIQPQSYDFLHFLNGSWMGQGITNGNDFKALSMFGQVNYTAWKKCYNVYTVDLERVSDGVTDEIIKNIQVSFKNDTPNTYNYLILIEYQNEVDLDRVSGQIVSTGSV